MNKEAKGPHREGNTENQKKTKKDSRLACKLCRERLFGGQFTELVGKL